MDDSLSFGIGCFHFGLKKKPPFKFEGSEYIKKLRTSLQSISNIDKIGIDCDEKFENLSIDVSEELPNIGKGPGFFPSSLFFMDIEFEVYIPFRIQAQLLEEKVEFLKTFTEKFDVLIRYTYHLPVTFVQPIDPSEKSTPSDAVIIVRRFLEQEFKKSKFDYTQFENLGPSPFHINCYIESEQTQCDSELDWGFHAERLSQKGYDDIVFNFNQKIFAEANEAKDAIMEEIQDELGFFYDVVQSEVVKMFDWEPIQDSVSELIAVQRLKGIKGIWKKVFVLSKLINEAFTAIAGFESGDICINNITQRDYRDIYLGREEQYFQSDIDKQMKERFVYPTKQTGELISFFESRRVKSVEILVVLTSAILGGVIGALLTILLSI